MKPLRLAVLALVGCGEVSDEALIADGAVEAADVSDDRADVSMAPGDVAAMDAASDAERRDSGARGDGARDSAAVGDGPRDSAVMDSGPRDSGVMDSGPRDTGVMDGGPRDVGQRDTGVMDSGPRDAGLLPVPRPADVRAGAECHELIRRLGVRFTIAGATRGIVDPVTVTTPIEGVHYRYASWSAAERPLLMDCRLAVALVRLGRELTSRWGIDDVQHIGIYNYRTIAGTTRLSQHAYATAIDIGALRARNGTTYSVLTDFTMNGAPTCPPRSTSARDRVLKEVACWMHSSRTFHIVLTPNYNSDHRNHFHVDLTTGSNFIQVERPSGVDPPHDPLIDWLVDDH